MLSFAQNVALLVITCLLALGFTLALNRVWPCEKRPVQNDLIGWQLSILGTTYAVILGFMLYAVWSEFGAAALNADLEASSLRNVYRLAAVCRRRRKINCSQRRGPYAAAVIDEDWPAMAKGQLPDASHEINEHMWVTLMSVKGASSSENTAGGSCAVRAKPVDYVQTNAVRSKHASAPLDLVVCADGGRSAYVPVG